MISVFTPLHAASSPYVPAAHESLRRQSIAEWEWIVLENHGGRAPATLHADERVRVIAYEAEGIGALKRAACAHARGEVLVELDADDLLAPAALERVAERVAGGADVVYSDFAEFDNDTGLPNVYSGAYGWRSYETRVEVPGAPSAVKAMVAPPVTAQNLRYIDWSPNHVRAWRREAYEAVGGHDPRRTVADDHDLLVRGFLAGQRFAHVPECLYLYRVHDQNAVKTMNGAIRVGTERVFNERIWSLAETWTRDAGLRRVDLCGGLDPAPGFEVWDRTRGHDLDGAWPAPDGSVGILRAYDAVEHLRDPVHTMNEAYRVLAPGGWLMISVPSTNGLGAFCDPTHVSFWNRLSFRYYTDRQFARYVPAYTGRFQAARVIEWFPTAWHREENMPYVEAVLLALKPGYDPMGEVLI